MMNSEKGQALPLALAALAVGMLVIAPFLGHASSNLIGSRVYGQVMSEQYSADAGVEYAIWNLQSGESEVPEGGELELPEFTINNKTVNVTIANESGLTYKITSTATSDDGSSTTIESRVLVTAGWVDYAIISNHTEGKLTLADQVVVNGDIYYAGVLEISGNAIINGDIIEGDPLNIGIDPEEYEAEAQSGGTHNGDLTIESGPYTLGPLYITGDLKIKAGVNVILGGTVYVAGKIKIGGDVTITGEGNLLAANQDGESKSIHIEDRVTIDLTNLPLIMSVANSGEIKVGDECDITGLMYSTEGRVHVSADGPSYVYGALIGKDVRVSQDTIITYHPALEVWAPYTVQIITWQFN